MDKWAEVRRTWAKDNPLRVKMSAKNFRLSRREFIDDLKDKPCADCGQEFPPECMDFDHRPDEVKVCNVATLHSRRKDLILAEVAKCDVVCANCHRIRSKKRVVEKFNA